MIELNNLQLTGLLLVSADITIIFSLQYFRVPEITIGGYDFEKLNGKPFPVKMTLRQYTEVDIDATTFRYTLNGRLNTSEIIIIIVLSIIKFAIAAVFYVTENQTAHEQYLIYSKDHLFNRYIRMYIYMVEGRA